MSCRIAKLTSLTLKLYLSCSLRMHAPEAKPHEFPLVASTTHAGVTEDRMRLRTLMTEEASVCHCRMSCCDLRTLQEMCFGVC